MSTPFEETGFGLQGACRRLIPHFAWGDIYVCPQRLDERLRDCYLRLDKPSAWHQIPKHAATVGFRRSLLRGKLISDMAANTLREREVLEAECSAIEAKSLAQRLRIHDIDRYRNPPLDTFHAVEYAIALAGDVRGKDVVDYGCGMGDTAVPLAVRGARVIGIDISPDLIELGKQRARLHGVDVDFRVGSCHETGLADACADIVFGTAILHHLDIRLAVKEITRLLKPGGFCVFKEPVRDNQLAWIVRRIFPAKNPHISPHEKPLLTRELLQAFDGMKLLAMRKFRLPHIVITGNQIWAWKLDRFLLKHLPLSAWATELVFKAQPR